jgi:aspartate/methionine/tyrosine aminotransferase
MGHVIFLRDRARDSPDQLFAAPSDANNGAAAATTYRSRASRMTRSISPAALLRDSGVAAAPGPDFDDLRGNRYMRFSFAGTEADIVEGIERLARWPK